MSRSLAPTFSIGCSALTAHKGEEVSAAAVCFRGANLGESTGLDVVEDSFHGFLESCVMTRGPAV